MPMDSRSEPPYGKITLLKVTKKFLIEFKIFSDKLLVKEVQELNENLPPTVKCEFPDHNNLAEFYLVVSPSEGLWKGGKFKFQVSVSEEYNMCPPKVKCLTKILHPNISCELQCIDFSIIY